MNFTWCVSDAGQSRFTWQTRRFDHHIGIHTISIKTMMNDQRWLLELGTISQWFLSFEAIFDGNAANSHNFGRKGRFHGGLSVLRIGAKAVQMIRLVLNLPLGGQARWLEDWSLSRRWRKVAPRVTGGRTVTGWCGRPNGLLDPLEGCKYAWEWSTSAFFLLLRFHASSTWSSGITFVIFVFGKVVLGPCAKKSLKHNVFHFDFPRKVVEF